MSKEAKRKGDPSITKGDPHSQVPSLSRILSTRHHLILQAIAGKLLYRLYVLTLGQVNSVTPLAPFNVRYPARPLLSYSGRVHALINRPVTTNSLRLPRQPLAVRRDSLHQLTYITHFIIYTTPSCITVHNSLFLVSRPVNCLE